MQGVVTYPKSSPVLRGVALSLPVPWKLVWMVHQRPAPCLPSPVQVKGKLLMRGGWKNKAGNVTKIAHGPGTEIRLGLGKLKLNCDNKEKV